MCSAQYSLDHRDTDCALVLENVAGQQDVDQVIEKIKTGFEEPFDVNSHSIRPGINIGCAIYPGDGSDMDTLISYADSGMYGDKHSRK